MAKDEIVTVQSGTLVSGPVISGSLEASRGATLVARVGGTVASVGPELGDHVRQGTVLARIEENALGSSVQSAKAAVETAKAQLAVEKKEAERDRKLVASGALPARDADASATKVRAQESALAQTQAQLATAQSQLGDTVVKAPITGVIARVRSRPVTSSLRARRSTRSSIRPRCGSTRRCRPNVYRR